MSHLINILDDNELNAVIAANEYMISDVLHIANTDTPERVQRSKHVVQGMNTKQATFEPGLRSAIIRLRVPSQKTAGKEKQERKATAYNVSIRLTDALEWVTAQIIEDTGRYLKQGAKDLSGYSMNDRRKVIYYALKDVLRVSDIMADCDCPDFRYRFRYTADNIWGASIIGEARDSIITNPEHKGIYCKHIIGALSAPHHWIPLASLELVRAFEPYVELLFNKIMEKVYEISDDEMDEAERQYDARQAQPQDIQPQPEPVQQQAAPIEEPIEETEPEDLEIEEPIDISDIELEDEPGQLPGEPGDTNY